MLLTLLPMIYSVTREPKKLLIPSLFVYAFPTIKSEFKITFFKPLQSKKALFPILVTFLGIVTEVKPVQLRNAFSPMLVTLLGIFMDLSLSIPKHKYAGIYSTLSPNVIDVTALVNGLVKGRVKEKAAQF